MLLMFTPHMKAFAAWALPQKLSYHCAAIDRETGRAKGFAHIQFDSLEAAAKALKMSGQDFDGREIFIDTAQERTGGGGGGFGGGAGGGGFERPPRSECSCMSSAAGQAVKSAYLSQWDAQSWVLGIMHIHMHVATLFQPGLCWTGCLICL